MTVTPKKHLVVFASYFWGHARPLSTFAARIAKMHNIVVTFIVIKSLYARVEAEIARDFRPEEKHRLERIRIIALEDGNGSHETSGAPGAFKTLWSRICHDNPLICAKTGAQLEPLQIRPAAALLDFFCVDAFDAVRELSGLTVKTYVWYACAANTFFPILGEDPFVKAKTEAERTGKSLTDAAFNMYWTPNGRLVHSPYGLTMHDYETQPQQCQLDRELVCHILMRLPRLLREVDGLVTFDAAGYQPKATAAIKQLYEARSRRAIFAGPLVPEGDQAMIKETSLSENGREIMAFLDKKLKTTGEHSVLYLSFGSFFWPSDPAKIWAVLDVLMEKGIPFIMSYAASYAGPIPDNIKAKVTEYGNAIVSNWVPQQALLDHPATGWYLMHGGHNGTLESIIAGVPMIVWPITADQPLNAIYLSEEANVAYELVEVRHGAGLGRIHRNGRTPVGTIDAVKAEARAVLDKAFGADGAEKRARLQVMRKTLEAAWAEDGVARREVAAFLEEF
ncbi:UDP-Glycosyltransferase/glycogen phosphorylase [Trametes gibbosa]|nr:UDP-Glycosyltransferase/glycogen phosphorylase [Trametes gibbosa]